MIDLMRLQTFLLAAEYLSFSETAKHLHLSQPTVSHHIKTLENNLGVQLFDRTGGSLKLTEAGHLLLPHASRLIRQTIELEQMMDSIGQQIIGQLRIACSTTTGKYILPQFAARFRRKHPGVHVSILRCTSDSVISSLLESDANLGVVSYDVCGSDHLECQEFFEDHIILIVPADHPWIFRQQVEPAELLQEPFLIREPTSGTRRVMITELGKHDIVLNDMDIFMELGNAEAIVRTVEAGFGVAFVSRSAATWALERGSVVEVPVAGFNLRRQVYMVQKTIREANRAVEAFWSFVHDPMNTDLLRMTER
jgi:DNA-binding transcriptional LysR family regulator